VIIGSSNKFINKLNISIMFGRLSGLYYNKDIIKFFS